MNLECAQNTRKVGAGREKETMSKTNSCGLTSVLGRRRYQEDTTLAVRQSEGNLAGAPRISIVKNLSGTSNYASGLKS
jgi:hypothetical protein